MKGCCRQRSTVLLLIEAKWPPWAIRFARLSSSLILSLPNALDKGQVRKELCFFRNPYGASDRTIR